MNLNSSSPNGQEFPTIITWHFSRDTNLLVNPAESKDVRKKAQAPINARLLPLLEKSEQSGGIFLRDNELGHSSPTLTYIQNDAFG